MKLEDAFPRLPPKFRANLPKQKRGFMALELAPVSLSELLDFNQGRARVFEFEAFLCGGIPVQRAAGVLHFASLWARRDGSSPLFSLSDDEACVAPLKRLGRELPPNALDPDRLYERLAWLERLFFGNSISGDAEWRYEFARVGTRDEWEAEISQLAEWPHLATHWLLQHLFFRHDVFLDEALATTKKMKHPTIRELHDIVHAVRARKHPPFGKNPHFVVMGTGHPGQVTAQWAPIWVDWFSARDPWNGTVR